MANIFTKSQVHHRHHQTIKSAKEAENSKINHQDPPKHARRSSRPFLGVLEDGVPNRRKSIDQMRREKDASFESIQSFILGQDMDSSRKNSLISLCGQFSPNGGSRHWSIDSGTSLVSNSNQSMADLKKFFKSPHRTSSDKSISSSGDPVSPILHGHPLEGVTLKYDGEYKAEFNLNSADDSGHYLDASETATSTFHKDIIYQDDAMLAEKYGIFGKELGSGAGGSVKVITRPSDNEVFAVKQFRDKKPNESMGSYSRKCMSEYLIGSTLLHPNIVETLDIFSDPKNNKFFQVMEFCPVDFFAVVTSGSMSRGEVNCCMRQMAEGVKYLHDKGLAHRDLKLDNTMMTEDGIVKIIDFGSATIFKYPFAKNTIMAHGIVGSDPYLAPEVLTSSSSYEPEFVDVWSLAIIYCCIILKRFPWKIPHPKMDENFRLYSLPDEMEHDYVESAKIHERLLKERAMKKHSERSAQLEMEVHHFRTPNYNKAEDGVNSPIEADPKPDHVTSSGSSNTVYDKPPAYRDNATLPHEHSPLNSTVNSSRRKSGLAKDETNSSDNSKTSTSGRRFQGPA
ncbi:hypothetical protein Kpol_1064p31, partial [Vanderwaltozyma polyspora DSM 70294]